MFYYYILFPLAVNRGFIYGSKEAVEIGSRVIVSFKNKEKIGVVWERAEKPNYDTKEILRVLDNSPVFDTELLSSLKFFSFYYMSYEGLMLKSALPKKLFQDRADFDFSVEKKDFTINGSTFELSEDQKKIVEQVDIDRFDVNVIFGVTGSGKTQVYLELISDVIKRGRQAVVMVPEIILTPQYLEIFSKRFSPDSISVIHSRLTPKQRFDSWIGFLKNRTSVLIGTRSAVFVSFRNVGIVVVDEENDESYKQESQPSYNAKDIAIYRAKKRNIPIILSSATPSVEVYFKAMEGKFRLFRLSRRIGSVDLPKVNFVKLTEGEIFSQETIKQMDLTLRKGMAVAVLMNRRGFANYLVCESCGYVFRCPNCSVTLTHHKDSNSLRCHWCESVYEVPKYCPKCGSFDIAGRGIGSQKVEEELKGLFPAARITRFDRDSVSRKGEFEKIINNLRDGRIDILVGTQMLSKGHDISKIGLVVVANFESMFVMPDFRASEKAVSLVIQTAGRSGRKQTGRVIVQTDALDNPFLKYIKDHNYESFVKSELKNRKVFAYPPFSRIIRVVSENSSDKKSFELINEIAKIIKVRRNVLGPSKCPIFKLRNRYRFHLILKTDSILDDIAFILTKIGFVKGIYFDVDPLNFF